MRFSNRVFIGILALTLLGVSSPGSTEAIPGRYCFGVKKELRSRPIILSLQTLSGDTISVGNANGEPTYVNFFATWCGPCNEEMPDVLRLSKAYKARGLRVILVDLEEKPDRVRKFVQRFSVDLPVAMDNDGQAAKIFGVREIPAAAFYNAKGVLTCLTTDNLSYRQLDNEASAAISGWMP